MNLNSITDAFEGWLSGILAIDWLSKGITIAVVLVVTALVSHFVKEFLRRVLKSEKGPIPAVSLFVNVARAIIWLIGFSVILSTCFGIDVGAAVTALGVGGIAVSLGFQETLSNLIGGLQITMTGLIEPGERIKVGTYEGKVQDVTLRHTTIKTVRGEIVAIPNSVINTQALVKLAPENDIYLDVDITETDRSLDVVVDEMKAAIDEAVASVARLSKAAEISITGKTEWGYSALVTLSIEPHDSAQCGNVVDTVMRAISASLLAQGSLSTQDVSPTQDNEKTSTNASTSTSN